MRRIWSLICWLMLLGVAQASQITLNIKNASLPDAIRFIATAAGMNVVISSAVTGSVSLAFDHASAERALESVLASQGLDKSIMGNIWYIASREELIKRKEAELKMQEVSGQAEPLLTSVIKIRYARAEDVARLLQDQQSSFISKRGTIHVDSRTNTLLIQDVAKSVAKARSLIAAVDVPVKQIMIEARLASIDTDFEREMGVDFSSGFVQNAAPGVGKYSLVAVTLANGSQLDIKLAALEAKGHAQLISAPRLFTANQQSAYIESGEEVPYQEVSESGGTAVTFKKAVLGLKVTPQLLPDRRVLLQLKINQDRPSARMVQGVPTISTRQMNTSVLVKNGETVVLGGIYELNDESEQRGLPFLSDIPVVGVLFKTQRTRHSKRELLVFVTPRLIE